MKTTRILHSSVRFFRASAIVLALLGMSESVRAQINDTITQSIWKMKWGVTTAQASSPAWRAGDDDKDGVKNEVELGAGTNPFSAGSAIKLTAMTVNLTNSSFLDLVFRTENGKFYRAQSSSSLMSPVWTNVGAGAAPQVVTVVGDGSAKTLTVPKTAGIFYRVLVEDIDTDGDHVSDWAEKTAGFKSDNNHSGGAANPDDETALLGDIASSNVVTVSATDSSALQPAAGAPAVDIGAVTVSRGGPLLFGSITVPLQKSGTATEGTDYDTLPSSVTFGPGQATIVLNINPVTNAARKTNVTAIVKALSGATYTLGSTVSAGVVINPAGTANGTGLKGVYSSGGNTNYSDSANFNTTTASGFNRIDQTVDFVFPTNGVPANTGGTANNAVAPVGQVSGTTYTVRWTGQVLPEYSETYYFNFRSDDGAKVWVNNVLLIDKWGSQSVTDYVNSIDLKAGTLYDIRIDYLNTGGNAEAHLYWYSLSQVRQIIPRTRLFPPPTTAQKSTAITSELYATGYKDVPFSFALAAPDISGAVTYALATDSAALPLGLTLSTSGLVSGTPTVVGTYNVVINATNTAAAAVTGSSVLNITIWPSGAVTRETLPASGPNIKDINQLASPVANSTIPTLDDDTDYSNNTGRRLRGYIVPPKTGNYYFWISASNQAELWISNDSEYVNKVRRATVTTASVVGKKTWNAQANQQSQWLAMEGGKKYYFEVLHNTGGVVDDHVAVGWLQDDLGAAPAVTGSPNPTGASLLIANGGAALSGYPYSGVTPSYIFQPYDYPVAVSSGGTLYAANLGPQGTAVSSASGSASISLNETETQAILRFTYGGLTTPKTAYHLHVDAFDNHEQGEIVFDLDDIDMFHPELKTADGGYIWDFAAGGTFATSAALVNALKIGKVYLNIHSVTYPNGEIRGTFTQVFGSQTPPDPADYVDANATYYTTPAAYNTDAQASRFLNQATFGPAPADIAFIKANGFDAWITDQVTKTPTQVSNEVVANIGSDINNLYPSSLFTSAWWKASVTGNDQLRQRLAFALSEIMVVSYNNDTGPLARNARILADYYDNLILYALPTAGVSESGNFRGILKSVTLTPAMGRYLDMLANQKGDILLGRHPNENYAREIMQLFSVGLNRMWDDGKVILDAQGGLIPVYKQPEILGLSAVLTGWHYAQAFQANGRAPTNFAPGADFLNPMVLVPDQHEMGESKLLLDSVVLPAATGKTPRVTISTIANATATTCTVTTATAHGLRTGDTITISGVTNGTFTGGLAAINKAFQATVTSTTAFTVPVQCTANATTGTVTGAKVLADNKFTGTSGNSPLSRLTAISGSQHDRGFNTVPNNPYDTYGLTELEEALDAITKNSNVGPYICRLLIQRLTTSSPSPGYVYRVVQKFNDNGFGVRGDMLAVVRQILLDGEVRHTTSVLANNTFGKQREPLLRVTGPARAFPAVPYTGTYTQLTGVNSNRLRIVTSAPNDFSSGSNVSLQFSNTLPSAAVNPTSTTYSVATTTAIAKTWTGIASIAQQSPAQVVTSEPHGLATGNSVTISGVAGGAFSQAITTARTITVVDATTFTINGVNCTLAPTSVAAAKMVSNPCRVTTTVPHGLVTGDAVTLTGVSGGTFTPSISGAFNVTKVDDTSFTIGSNCTAPSTDNTGNIVGANTLEVSATGMTNATYAQSAGSDILTVNTGGPTTNATVPATTVNITSIVSGGAGISTVTTSAAHNLVTGGRVAIAGVTDGAFDLAINGTFTPTVISPTSFTVPVNCTTSATTGTSTKKILSRVYLMFLTQTAAGGATIAADGIYDVLSNPSGSSFTVSTTTAPVTARAGNVIVPKFTTSYTPETSNTIIKYNNSVNHNLLVGDAIWVDAPVVNSPITDAAFAVTQVIDEDHFRTSYLPINSNGGTYPKPSGSNNGVTIYPLVAPPMGRTGSVTINQSTFAIGGTDGVLSQTPFNSPTVFNFFYPDYRYPGTLANTNNDSPEFQLSTDTNISNLTNAITNMFLGTSGTNNNPNGLSSFNGGGGGVVFDIGEFMETTDDVSNAQISNLVDTIAARVMGVPLDLNTKTVIVNFVADNTRFPYGAPATPTQKRDRVRAIIHLILISAEYAVQK